MRKRIKVRRPIALKLVSIILGFLFIALAGMTVSLVFLLGSDTRATSEDNNFNLNHRIAFNAAEFAKKTAKPDWKAFAKEMQSLLSNTDATVFIIDENATSLVRIGSPISISLVAPFIRTELASDDASRQQRVGHYLCAFEKLNTTNTNNAAKAIVTVLPESNIDALVRNLVQQILYISVAVLLLSAFFIIIFSQGISHSLKRLVFVANRIEEGDYKQKLKVHRKDEIGDLQSSFIGMETGLENFEKFTNKMVVKMARKGFLTRSGTTKNAAVLFAFIKDFETRWENSDAEEVVSFVNSFLQCIVPCISATEGVVDKFLTQGGVIVMAVWGTLIDTSPRDNAYNAVHASLLMRDAVEQFNKQNNKDVQIGCAVNCGELVAGQIGGEDRLEYTVIGDTVNLAARLQGPNDLFKTDLLITENIYTLLQGTALCREMPAIKVKGKSEALRSWTVLRLKERRPSLLRKALSISRLQNES
ncbi:MAG: HAMP domain-containing protein [Spirochaetaceae bacterium]|jgi:class 3 adenylate cyclase/HAMP domain-containing protein|nr:HAMP domain-containing protein [Spirochaetaceae bacterium]